MGPACFLNKKIKQGFMKHRQDHKEAWLCSLVVRASTGGVGLGSGHCSQDYFCPLSDDSVYWKKYEW